MQTDVLIVGGGVMGSSVAYHLAKRGKKSVLLERDKIGSHASSAAAGMLGAQGEMDEPGPLTDFCLTGRSMFSTLSTELLELTGIDIELNEAGLLKLAYSEEDVERLQARKAWQTANGLTALWLEPQDCLELEPQLYSDVRGALFLPFDWQVSAPKLTLALATAARNLGVQIMEQTEVLAIKRQRGRQWCVETAAGRWIAEQIVITTGAWAHFLANSIGWELAVSPVRGESLALLPKRSLFQHTLFGPGCYLVPKANGEIIVGATERAGVWEEEVTAEAVMSLLHSAIKMVPELKESVMVRSWAGLRPRTHDGLPYIGTLGDLDNAVVATGHYRNGILLSAATGDAVARLILGEMVPEIAAFSPNR